MQNEPNPWMDLLIKFNNYHYIDRLIATRITYELYETGIVSQEQLQTFLIYIQKYRRRVIRQFWTWVQGIAERNNTNYESLQYTNFTNTTT